MANNRQRNLVISNKPVLFHISDGSVLPRLIAAVALFSSLAGAQVIVLPNPVPVTHILNPQPAGTPGFSGAPGAPVAGSLPGTGGSPQTGKSGAVIYTCDPNIDATKGGTCSFLNVTIAGLYSSTFTDANVSIYIQYGNTGLGESVKLIYEAPYSSYLGALTSGSSGDTVDVDALASLPASEPAIFGGDNIGFTGALGRALGGSITQGINTGLQVCTLGTTGCYDGILTLAFPDLLPGGQSYFYRSLQAGAIGPEQYDFFTVVEHETDEMLGTSSCISTDGSLSNPNSCAAPADLFRYSAPGTRVFVSTTPGAYFSYNGGTTNVAVYNTLANGDDYADWVTNCQHVQDATGCLGESFDITTDGRVEITVLDAVGFNLNPVGPPTLNAVSVTPNSGTGTSQVFTAVYTDSAGTADLQAVYLDFGSVYFAAHNCIVSYVPTANQLYLYKDDNSGAIGPITLGAGSSLTNSQCTVFGGGTAATASGTTLTVPFNIQFLPAYGGLKQVFGLAQSFTGTQSGGGVPNDLGTWTPSATTPGVVSVSPNSGSGTGPEVFAAEFSDSGGANDLQAVYLDFASVYFAAHNCEVVYTPGLNQLYLFNDGNNGALGPIALGAGGGTLSNSQCTLSSGTTAATLSGDTLTVPFTITFKAGYGGLKTIFALSQTYAGVQSGGGVPATLGSWTTSASTPSVGSVSPVNSTGLSQVFTAVYGDTGGGNDLQVVDLTFGPALNAASSCAVVYTPGLNQLYLYNDAGNGVLGPISEGAGGGSLSNTQCTLTSGTNAATLTGAGNPTTLNVPFTITFKNTFTGAKTVWGYAQTYGGTDSAVTNLGSWTP
jgi:hypothetical protein